MFLSSEELSSFSSYFGVLSKNEHFKFWDDCLKIIKYFLRNHLMPDHIAKISDISRYFSISTKFSVFWSISGLKRGMLCRFQHVLSMLNPNYWGLAHKLTKFESMMMNIFRIVPWPKLAQQSSFHGRNNSVYFSIQFTQKSNAINIWYRTISMADDAWFHVLWNYRVSKTF